MSPAGGAGLIPDWGTEIPHATWCGQKVKVKKNSFSRYKCQATYCMAIKGYYGKDYKI